MNYSNLSLVYFHISKRGDSWQVLKLLQINVSLLYIRIGNLLMQNRQKPMSPVRKIPPLVAASAMISHVLVFGVLWPSVSPGFEAWTPAVGFIVVSYQVVGSLARVSEILRTYYSKLLVKKKSQFISIYRLYRVTFSLYLLFHL